MIIALTRAISPKISECELTHLEREAIDFDVAVRQHSEYERTLEALGCRVMRIEEAPQMPDSVFIEDTAVVLDELAIITRPGAPSRRGETAAVEVALAAYRPVHRIEAPATLDGGDVLRVGRRLFAGVSGRTNDEALVQMRAIVDPFGYDVEGVPVTGCLHLKTAVTAIASSMLLLNPEWVDRIFFEAFETIEVDPLEPSGANALVVGDVVLYPAAFPRTAARLRERGLRVELLDASELAKAEGALTCCSVIVEESATRRPASA